MATWNDWIGQHALIFGQQDERDLAALATWAGIFAGEGWTADELLAASRWVAVHDPPRFRDAMLRSLQDRVRGVRAKQTAPEVDEDPFGARRCPLCDWTGWAPVPCAKSRAAGKFVRGIACCTCSVGRRKLHEGDQNGDLEAWFNGMPDWRDWYEAQERRIAADLAASAEADVLDRKLGALAMPAHFARVIEEAQRGGQG